MTEIVMYSSPICPFCTRARALLRRKAVDFKEIDVLADSKHKTEMIEKAGGRRTVPQIFVGKIHVGGCDELMALEQKGELDPLLDSASSA